MPRESMVDTQRRSQARTRTSKEQRIEVPTGGWNTRDALDDIPPQDAILLDNWIPDIGAVRIRPGFTVHVDTGVGKGKVNSLFEYHDNSDLGRKLFAAIDDKIYDVSSAPATDMTLPAVPPAIERSINSIYDVAMIETEDSDLNAMQVWVNGSDNPLIYNGANFDSRISTYTFIPFYAGGTSPTPNQLKGVTTFKNRLYYWTDESQVFWYTELYSVDGNLTQFPLGATGNYGGKLVAIETWTRDGGSGPDDFIVFFMSSGEAIVYQGSSPEDIYNWALVGRYDIGEPITSRAVIKIGGDIMVVTSFGYVSFSELLQGVEANSGKSKIDGAARGALRQGLPPFGWEIISFPTEKLLIFNVPTRSGIQQHVMNQVTGAWCRFTGIDANTFCMYKNDLYFGSNDGIVYQAFNGESDAGEPIKSDIQLAWLKLGGTTPKTFVAFKELYRSTREVNISIEFGVDFAIMDETFYPTAIQENLLYWTNEDNVEVPGSPWVPPPPGGSGALPNGDPVGDPTLGTPLVDPLLWFSNENYAGSDPPPQDQVTNWSGVGNIVFGEWEFIEGNGSVISMRKKMSTLQFYETLSFRFLYEMGGRL